MLKKGTSYQAVYDTFEWRIPEFYNIGTDICDRQAAHEYPREIEFIDDLPLTATGKIIRKDLRTREALPG